MSVVAAPLKYGDVTAEWLTRALREKWPKIAVTAVRRGPIFGYKQNKFRIEVDYDDSGHAELPRTYIVKGNFPGENDPSTGSLWAMVNELRSIRDVVPWIAAPAMPEWYYIGVDTDASAIVMQDLAPKGAIFFDAFRTLEIGQAMAFMDAFARMHASSWNSKEFSPGGAMGPGSFAAENRHIVNDIYFPTFFRPDNWRSYVELPRGRILPRQFQNLDRSEKAWSRMWAMLEQAAMVVVHGDEHLGNVYMTASGTPGVIDWVARPERWPIGVAYFLVCALDIVDRRAWERVLISHYLTRLKVYGAFDVPRFEEAWFLYRCTTFYPLVTWLNNSAVWQPEAINAANAARAAVAALDHDAFGLLGA
jgi:hypothetical protein